MIVFTVLAGVNETVIFIELITNPNYSIFWQGLKFDFSGCVKKLSFDKSKIIFEMVSQQELCVLFIVIRSSK